MKANDGWAPWALFVFVVGALALTALAVSVALNARQTGTLFLGLIGASVGALFLINAPGWARQGRG